MLVLITKLNINRSPGPDGIHPRVIKDLKAGTVDLLTKTRNLFLLLASVVENWKLASVTPIFKNGPWGNPRNYRPVSLTSVLERRVETAIKNYTIKHLETQPMFKDTQHGLTKDASV